MAASFVAPVVDESAFVAPSSPSCARVLIYSVIFFSSQEIYSYALGHCLRIIMQVVKYLFREKK